MILIFIINRTAKEFLSMYVCMCHGVTDSEVKKLVAEGKKTLAELYKSCRAGSDCGTCVCELKKLLKQQKEELLQPLATSA